MRLFDIQHFCTHDGPGIRTTVFFKGCPLHCQWCHNPESQSFESEVLYNVTRCVGCGACGGNHHSKAEVCLYGGMESCGREYSVSDVIEEIIKDKSYYVHSGGGITLSGGEPMAQPLEALSLLAEAKERSLHTAIETSGCGLCADYKKMIPVTDLFIWDVKLMDSDLYERYTGGNLRTMLSNLAAVSSAGAEILLRILFIPEIHLSEPIVEATRALLCEYPSAQKEIIPYHPLGNSKRVKLGLPEIRFREPDPGEIERFRSRISP